jgi:hypothetical protein
VDSKQEAPEKWIPVRLVILGAIAYVASMFFRASKKLLKETQ